MRFIPTIALIVAAFAGQALAADEVKGQPPEGAVCLVREFRSTDQVPIGCIGLGEFSSIDAIYKRGYRVVSSGVLAEAGKPVYLIIERK